MQRLAFFFLGVLVVTLGAGAPSPLRPADGTYVYTLAGVPGATTSTVVVRTDGASVSTTETLMAGGAPAVAETDYDTSTLLPTRYRAGFHGTTTDISFAGTTATIVNPPVTVHANAGADPLTIGDGLIAYLAMIPSVLAAHPATPISVFSINGGVNVTTIASAPANQTRPVDVPAGDIASAATATVSGLKFSFWTDPQTHAVDAIDIGGAKIRLASHTDSTVALTPGPAATPYPTAPPSYADRDVSFASAGATLAGTLSVPRANARRRYPAFVFVHGSGAGTRDGALAANPTFLLLANRLANAGYAVLRYDKRGIGKSDGTPTESWKPLGDDARAAVAYLRTLPDIDPHRIFVLGHSEGGLIAPVIAPGIHPALAGIVLMAGPAISMAHILDEQLAGAPPSARAKFDVAFRDYAGLEPTVYITKVDVPILVLQGSRDTQVLAKDLPPMVAAARKAKRNITVRILDGDDHLFIHVPANVKADAHEYFIPAPLDPRVGDAILTWANAIP